MLIFLIWLKSFSPFRVFDFLVETHNTQQIFRGIFPKYINREQKTVLHLRSVISSYRPHDLLLFDWKNSDFYLGQRI